MYVHTDGSRVQTLYTVPLMPVVVLHCVFLTSKSTRKFILFIKHNIKGS